MQARSAKAAGPAVSYFTAYSNNDAGIVAFMADQF
jgi:hypothetical protein